MNTTKQLLDLLEENGYEASDENLQILAEDLSTGNAIVLDSSNLSLYEGMDEDYLFMQILDKNGFLVNENNLSVLKEAYENGHVLLTEAKKTETKPVKVAKEIAKTVGAIGVGAALGAGAGRLADHVHGNAAEAANTKMANATDALDTATAEQARWNELDELVKGENKLSSADQKFYDAHKGSDWDNTINTERTKIDTEYNTPDTQHGTKSDGSAMTKKEKITQDLADARERNKRMTGTKVGAVVGATAAGTAVAGNYAVKGSKALKAKHDEYKEIKAKHDADDKYEKSLTNLPDKSSFDANKAKVGDFYAEGRNKFKVVKDGNTLKLELVKK